VLCHPLLRRWTASAWGRAAFAIRGAELRFLNSPSGFYLNSIRRSPDNWRNRRNCPKKCLDKIENIRSILESMPITDLRKRIVSSRSSKRGTSDCESNRVSYMQCPIDGESYAQNSLQFITTHNISENSRYHDIRIFNHLDVSVVTAGWSCAMGVPQHCTLRCLNRVFNSLLFSRALQIFAPQTGRTGVFRENSTVQSAGSGPLGTWAPKMGRNGGSQGQKSSTASGSDRASPPRLDANSAA
jgi:hypothetical protein